jgi:hypothetical protein
MKTVNVKTMDRGFTVISYPSYTYAHLDLNNINLARLNILHVCQFVLKMQEA